MVCREDGNVTQINRTSPCHVGASRNFWPRDCFIVLAYLWIQIFWITVHSDAPVVFFSFHSYRSSNGTTRFFYVMKRRGTNEDCSSFTSMFECGSRFFLFFVFFFYIIRFNYFVRRCSRAFFGGLKLPASSLRIFYRRISCFFCVRYTCFFFLWIISRLLRCRFRTWKSVQYLRSSSFAY